MARISRSKSATTETETTTGPPVAVPVAAVEVVAQHGNIRRIVFHEGQPSDFNDGHHPLPSEVAGVAGTTVQPGTHEHEHHEVIHKDVAGTVATVRDIDTQVDPLGNVTKRTTTTTKRIEGDMGEGLPIHSIRAEVDRIGSRTSSRPSLASETPLGTRTSSSVLYRTARGGSVSETRVSDGTNERRMLYLSRRDADGREHQEPFNSNQVDPLIRNVNLREESTTRETVTEYVDGPTGAGGSLESPQVVGSADARIGFEPDYRRVVRARPDELVEAPSSAELATQVTTRTTSTTTEDAWDPDASQVSLSRGRRSSTRSETPAPEAREPIIIEVPVEVPVTKTRTVTRTVTRKPRPRNVLAYEGDEHDVLDVEGIGPTIAKKLHRIGVLTTNRLCLEEAQWVADQIDVPVKRVKTWQAMADLMKVKGIGKQYAEALARAGIGGIDDLKERSPTRIAATVTKYLDSLDNNVLGNTVTETRVATWQKAAKPMRKHKFTLEGHA